MDIQQFCDMLKEARKLSGVPWIDVCYRMRKTQSTILDMLCGKRDPSMAKIFNYIEAIEAEIVIKDLIFCHEPELHKWLNSKCVGLSDEKIGDILHITRQTVYTLRYNKSHYKVSYFLEILDYLGLPCQVLPIGIKIESPAQ